MKPKRLIEKTWFRALPFIFGGILLLLIAAGAAVAIRWQMSVKEAADPVLIGEPVYELANGKPTIGTHFNAVLKYRLPWSDSFKVAAAEPGKNLQLTSDPAFRRSRIRWGCSDWTVVVPLQAYRSGESGGGSVLAEFFAGKSIETPLPELKIADLALPLDDTGTELSLAPRIESLDIKMSWLTAGAVAAAVILVSLAAWALLARKKREAAKHIKTAWERALDAIRALREHVRGGSASPELAVAGLTDIVRHYLEARFRLRAERQTTAEFLADLERNDRLLEDKDRRFLRSFLASADMVKFACLPADPHLFEQASEKAEELVSGTIPREDGLSAESEKSDWQEGGRK
jgi:hypothetical protein